MTIRDELWAKAVRLCDVFTRMAAERSGTRYADKVLGLSSGALAIPMESFADLAGWNSHLLRAVADDHQATQLPEERHAVLFLTLVAEHVERFGERPWQRNVEISATPLPPHRGDAGSSAREPRYPVPPTRGPGTSLEPRDL